MEVQRKASRAGGTDGFLDVWKFVHDRSGMPFADGKLEHLRQRVTRRMRQLGLRDYKDYLRRMVLASNDKEFRSLMGLITTNETSFFRDAGVLDSFVSNVLVPMAHENGSERGLRIWSAGCSTGEEPYTLSMLALDTLPSELAARVEIVATDISERALSAAWRGTYAPAAVRGLERKYIERYFEFSGDHYQVSADVRARVRFAYGNLMDDQLPTIVGPVDIIFCRNVMIYFSQRVRREVAARIEVTLNPGGYLILGSNETLHNVSDGFDAVYPDNILMYRKPGAAR